ncbi:hypothetical protein OH77DRAFT_1406258 [Trametes cingulata]|nr:hypothetical protein OH77DRAFT_1406258 [Trametes cingulata]
MSSDDENIAQEILDSFSRILAENYCIIASSVLLFADSIITFPDEVQRIWKRRFTGATAVFLITRYVAVAERIVLVTSVFLPTLQDKVSLHISCVPVLRMDDALTDISYLMFGVFMMLRARGIWGEGWLPIAFLALLTPVRAAITIYIQANYTPIAFGIPLYGCGAAINLSAGLVHGLRSSVGVASRLSALVIDLTVLILTWVRTIGIKRQSSRLGLHTPIVTLLLRDGTIYFLIILFVQVFSIVSVTVCPSFILWDVWPFFDQVFTVIFCCRFMLNLRGVYFDDRATDTGYASHTDTSVPTMYFSSLRFPPAIVGNLGAPLDTFGIGTKDEGTFSSSEGYSDDTAAEGFEVSNDPLFAGLHHPAGIELPETPTTAQA